ncbi:hypothetical protein Tco_1056267 [Tanacetum coccineum]|uniref:Integrase zinc-binding domain-containing protein n=1 Tax=Tanacetum coccineum TaxID=301880 RepID=A0ABQ5H2P5_9ASTR
MDDPNITIEEYIRLEEDKARRHGKVYNWGTATYGRNWYDDDVHDLRSVETKFPAIVFNDTLTSEVALSCEPMVSSLDDNKVDFRISFDESNDEDYTVNTYTPYPLFFASIIGRKVYEAGFFWPSIFKEAKDYVMRCDACQRSGNISSRSEMPLNNIQDLAAKKSTKLVKYRSFGILCVL